MPEYILPAPENEEQAAWLRAWAETQRHRRESERRFWDALLFAWGTGELTPEQRAFLDSLRDD